MGVDVTFVPLEQLCLVERRRVSGGVEYTASVGRCRDPVVGSRTVTMPLPISKYLKDFLQVN